MPPRPAASGRPHRTGIMEPMRRTLLGILAALILLASTACTVTQKDPDYVPPAPLPALEQLTQAPLADAAKYAAGQDILSFATADRNVVCSLTSARGGHVNLPYEQNGFADSANNKLATVPVAHCELAAYPKPDAEGHHGRLRRDGPRLPRRRRAAHPGEGRIRRMPLRRHTAGSRIRAQGQPQGPHLPAARPRRRPEPGAQRPALLGLQRRCRLRKRLRRRRLLRFAGPLRTDPDRRKKAPQAPSDSPKNPVI